MVAGTKWKRLAVPAIEESTGTNGRWGCAKSHSRHCISTGIRRGLRGDGERETYDVPKMYRRAHSPSSME